MPGQLTRAQLQSRVEAAKALLGERYVHEVVAEVLRRNDGILAGAMRLAFDAGRHGAATFAEWLDGEAAHLHIDSRHRLAMRDATLPIAKSTKEDAA